MFVILSDLDIQADYQLSFLIVVISDFKLFGILFLIVCYIRFNISYIII